MMWRRLAAKAPFDIWAIDLSIRPDDEQIAILSSDEMSRARRLHFARDRRRYLAAHVALRHILAVHGGGAPAAQVFAGVGGKPRLASRPSLDFSLSYAEDTALVAVADGMAIGVDIEALRPIHDLDGLMELVFTAAERRACSTTAPGRARDRSFLNGWTRKEACLKAIGSGLSTDPSTFEAGLDGTVRAAVEDRFGRTEVDIGSFELGNCLGAWARIASYTDRTSAAVDRTVGSSPSWMT